MISSLFNRLQAEPIEVKGWYRGNKHLKTEKCILSKDESVIKITMTNDDKLIIKDDTLSINGTEVCKMKDLDEKWIFHCYEDYLKRKGWKMI
jgi:hypothetical protein